MRQFVAAVAIAGITITSLALSAHPQDPSPKKPPIRLVNEKTDQLYREFLPNSNDGVLDKLKADPEVIFYDHNSMPPAYQDWRPGGLNGVHSPSYNISATQPFEPFGNANLEFPWLGPAGTNRGDNHRTYKFVKFPETGTIKIHQQVLAGDGAPSYLWTYPKGTIFGEVICVHNNRTNGSYTCEVRTRIRGETGWSINAYRPFLTPEQLIEAVSQLPESPANSKLVLALQRPKLKLLTMKNTHEKLIFSGRALEEELPAISDESVVKLLTTAKFQSALGQEWRVDGKEVAHAPTTTADFHIVPKGYNSHFIPVNSKSCMQCHNSVLDHASDVQMFVSPGRLRDWYGRVRGSDGIFSFHPFALESISYNGYGQPIQFRPELVRAGKVSY